MFVVTADAQHPVGTVDATVDGDDDPALGHADPAEASLLTFAHVPESDD